MFLDKFYIWEKSCSWDIGQKALSQSDCRILRSIIYPKQIDETASFLVCWYKFTKIKSYWKFFVGTWSKVGLAEMMELADFLYAGTNSCKLKDDWKCQWLA